MANKPIIEHFEFCPACGAKSISFIRDVGIRCSECDFELYFNPNSSAATLIEDANGKLLVIRRAKEPAKGKYGLPGGFVDIGETAESTARREAKEEVNLDIKELEFLGSWPNGYAYKGVAYPVLDTYFIGRVDSFDAIKACEHEVAGIEFVDPAAVPEEQWAFTALRKAIKAYLAQR
ncbi:MAG: NUDIX domain-containing protein [Verrucomicrobiota bacterium]